MHSDRLLGKHNRIRGHSIRGVWHSTMVGGTPYRVHYSADDIVQGQGSKVGGVRGGSGSVVIPCNPAVAGWDAKRRVVSFVTVHMGALESGNPSDIFSPGIIGVTNDDYVIDIDAVEEGLGVTC